MPVLRVWFACPIGPRDTVSEQTTQKTYFLAAAAAAEHTKNTASNSWFA
jgi:hypothetical protein